METNRTYTAIRMATGKTTHLSTASSSQTMCGRWTGNTRQFTTNEKEITCIGCVNHMIKYLPDAIAQGFTKKEGN